MKADTYELKGILGKERLFVIPTFQRDYEWTRDGQWELLFQDLDSLADRLYEARLIADSGQAADPSAEKRVAPHFLGAVVCDQVPTSTGDIDTRAVIDGQQRLTTLQLLIRGLLDVLQESGSSRATRVRRLLINPEDIVTPGRPEHGYKLWPRRKDREVWPVAMADEVPTSHLSHPYVQARQYFAREVRLVKDTIDGDSRLEVLTDALLDLFKIVVIDLDENDDAQIIFEVLNGRQTPLSASDLVKNLLFLRAERAREDVEDLYDRYWALFDEPWWKENAGIGHAARERRDQLLSVWLTAASGEAASVAHLYGEVRRYLDSTRRKPHEVVRELHRYGLAYRAIYDGTALVSPRVHQAYGRLIRFNVTTALPLLTWFSTIGPERLSGYDHERAVLAVESWVIRRMLRGANTRGYGLAFLNVLKAAQRAERSGHHIADAVIEALDNDSRSLGWPDDVEIQQLFVEKPVYRDLSAERLRMVFGAIDEELQQRNHRDAAAVFDYERLQIEHIMPQKWGATWPLTAEMPPGAEQLRDTAVHTAGNLTLVTSTFNNSVSNGSWSAKRPEFAKQSKLEINRGLGGAATWDEATIAQRAAVLASVAIDVWRSPQALLSRGDGQNTAEAAPAALIPVQPATESTSRSSSHVNTIDVHEERPDTTPLAPPSRYDQREGGYLLPGNNDRRWFSLGFSGTRPNSRNDMANAAYAVVAARPGQPQNTGLVFAAFDDESRAIRFMTTWAAKQHSCWLVTAHPDRSDLTDEQREALIIAGGVLATALPNEPLMFHDPPLPWPGT